MSVRRKKNFFFFFCWSKYTLSIKTTSHIQSYSIVVVVWIFFSNLWYFFYYMFFAKTSVCFYFFFYQRRVFSVLLEGYFFSMPGDSPLIGFFVKRPSLGNLYWCFFSSLMIIYTFIYRPYLFFFLVGYGVVLTLLFLLVCVFLLLRLDDFFYHRAGTQDY